MKNYDKFFLVGIVIFLCIVGYVLLKNLRCIDVCNNAKESKDTLIVGMMSGWAPFMTINGNGEYEGFDVDVAKEIAQRMNRTLIIEDLGSLASCFIALDQQRIDMIMSGLDITEKRREKVAMIRYTGENVTQFSLIFWQNIPEGINCMESLRQFFDAVVCVESGSSQEKFLDSYDFILKKRMDSVVNMVLDLRFGKSLAAVLEPRVAARLRKKNPEIKILPIPLPQDFQVFGCGITLNKNNNALIKVTNEIVQQMYTDGTLKKLEQKWQLEG